ncbi:MAG: hypothetical protein K9L62_10825 [Vallitaleaceae bacterium]|nr:hypothetical protein [Vallitaleaceae bacterium]
MTIVRKYRGVAGKLRYAFNSGRIQGEITRDACREVLCDEKFQGMPNNVIDKTLFYMKKNAEIQRIHGVYYTKELKNVNPDTVTKPPTIPLQQGKGKKEACVLGRLISTKMVDGKMIAEVEVASIDFK